VKKLQELYSSLAFIFFMWISICNFFLARIPRKSTKMFL
jgi:hypothetical protein